ncbi:MAG: VWA domain-containing protein [Anaerotignum sp.]
MFLNLFYTLRNNEIKVSMHEWLTLMNGLDRDLHYSSLSGFYGLCRSTLVHSERDFGRFNQAFFACFDPTEGKKEWREEMNEWLESIDDESFLLKEFAERSDLSVEEVEKLYTRRLEEQTEAHRGGNKWIGTDGKTAFGNMGQKLRGIRVGGESQYRSAYRIIEEGVYEDFRNESAIQNREFQLAFKRLRQQTSNSTLAEDAFDLDKTIDETCKQAGALKIKYKRPRTNSLKLLLLMDTGGSMKQYSKLCSELFQSVSKAGHFKDLKIYYFHNALGEYIHSEPTMEHKYAVSVEYLLQNLSSEYRVIIVGDGEMSMEELLNGNSWYNGEIPKKSGLDFFLQIKKHFKNTIWLHPQPTPKIETYWTHTFRILERHFDMFRLSLDGLNEGIKTLLN